MGERGEKKQVNIKANNRRPGNLYIKLLLKFNLNVLQASVATVYLCPENWTESCHDGGDSSKGKCQGGVNEGMSMTNEALL